MEFQPILILAIIWLLIGLPLSKLSNKAKQQQAARKAKSPGAKALQQKPDSAAHEAPEPARRRHRRRLRSLPQRTAGSPHGRRNRGSRGGNGSAGTAVVLDR